MKNKTVLLWSENETETLIPSCGLTKGHMLVAMTQKYNPIFKKFYTICLVGTDRRHATKQCLCSECVRG